jgi:hypothetical protein
MSQTLTPTQVTETGVEELTLAAATDVTLKIPNDGKTMAIVANGSGSPITATLEGQRLLDLGVSADQLTTIPAGETWYIFLGPPGFFNDQGGEATLTLSDTTTITVAALTLQGEYN